MIERAEFLKERAESYRPPLPPIIIQQGKPWYEMTNLQVLCILLFTIWVVVLIYG